MGGKRTVGPYCYSSCSALTAPARTGNQGRQPYINQFTRHALRVYAPIRFDYANVPPLTTFNCVKLQLMYGTCVYHNPLCKPTTINVLS